MKIHRWLLVLLLLILPLGQFSRLPLGDTSLTVYLNDLLLPLIIFFWIIDLLRRIEKFTLPSLSTPIFLIIIVGIASLVWNSSWLGMTELAISSLYLYRFIMYVLLYFVAYDLVKSDPSIVKTFKQDVNTMSIRVSSKKVLSKNKNILFSNDNLTHERGKKEMEVKFFLNLLVGVGFVVALFGIAQYLVFPDFSSMVAHGWDPHYYRVLSTFFDPNFVGGFLVMNLALVVALSLEVESWEKFDLFKAVIAIIILLAIVLTFSRSTYLMFVVTMGLIGLIRSRKVLVLGILIGVLTIVLIPRVQERIVGGFINIDPSASFRFQSWEKGWEIAKDNLAIGVGYNSYRYAQIKYDFIQPWSESDVNAYSASGVDSSLLLVLATLGLPGFFIYLLFILQQAYIGAKGYLRSRSPYSKVASLTVFAVVIGLLVHSQFVNSLFYPFILEWLIILVGVAEGSQG